MTDDIADRLDEIERLRAVATDYASLASDEGGKAFDQARYELVHITVPELVAAIRAVLALADDLDAFVAARGEPSKGSFDHALNLAQGAAAAEIRRALADALAPQPRPEGTQR
jgi:hypothetical protein